MKKLNLLRTLIIAILFGFGAFTANAQGEASNYDKGVARIKVSNGVAAQFAELHKRGDLNVITGKTGIAEIDALNTTYGVTRIKRVFRYAGKHEAKHVAAGLHLWYEIEFAETTKVNDVLNAYEGTRFVQDAEPRYIYSKREAATLSNGANDPQYSGQWHYNNTGQTSGTVDADIDLPEAWTLETGNSSVVVAIEDGGIDVDHPDLVGNMWINSGEIPNNGQDDDNNGYVDDYHGYNFGDNTGTIPADTHGSHVAGTVAAETNNGIGLAGVAGGSGSNDGARIMACTVFGANSNGGFDEAFIYAADNGAAISQNSWGGGGQSNAIENAIDYFISNGGGSVMNGGVVIFAAGNDNSSSASIGYPASYSPAIAVAATNDEDKKSYYSNYGSWVDISAPGGELFQGGSGSTGIQSTVPVGSGSYDALQGTSMACPHVSGVAALVVSKAINDGVSITPAQVRSILENNVDNHYGVNGSYTGQLGSGRLNAFKAVQAVTGGGSNPDPDPEPSTYCTSQGNNAQYEWIAGVAIGSFTNNSSGAGYTDFTSQTVSLAAGSTSNVTLTPGFASSSYNEYWKIWIDFNGDGDFGDSGEQVFGAGLSSSAVTGTLTIPAGTAATTTRMRVSMKYNGQQTACEAFSYGEVEDYTVEITEESTPEPEPVTYCDATGNQNGANDEWIDRVSFGGITKTSGNDGYADYTNLVGTMAKGTNSITFSAAFGGRAYNEGYMVWIDYNQDGDFTSDEVFVQYGLTNSSSNITRNGTIPASAKTGQTRLRIALKYNGYASACESYTYGEVEDYTVNIVNSLSQATSPVLAETTGEETFGNVMKVYPNPATDVLNIGFVKGENVKVQIFDLAGAEVISQELNERNLSVNVANLKQGMYIISVTSGELTERQGFMKK